MLDTSKLSESTIKDIAHNLGWEAGLDIVPYVEQIKEMSVEETFDCWCVWNGLLDWGDIILGIVDELNEAESGNRNTS